MSSPRPGAADKEEEEEEEAEGKLVSGQLEPMLKQLIKSASRGGVKKPKIKEEGKTPIKQVLKRNHLPLNHSFHPMQN